MKFTIGTTDQKQVKVDAMVLSDTRGLICASSGLGKSWLMRLISENVASSVQTVIIDPEGEFSTLREKLDVLIVSESGDLRADIRSAGLLARKLAETGVSAVIDIYDLPGKEDPWVKRRMFVAELINELMNLPKKLYHPMIVMVDEAHQFAQEETTSDSYVLNGTRVQPSLLSRSAIRSLMSAGRKRGIGGILATQRISKIDKDAIADARNVFIGGTTLDIDQRRAGDILGMSKSEFATLRDLEPGSFFAFGPAIDGKGIVRFKSSDVQTTHPKAGQRSKIVVPKASTQIAGIVEQIGDLPAAAEEEVKTLDALKRENADLKRELKTRPTVAQAEVNLRERVEVPVLPQEQYDGILNSLSHLQEHAEEIKAVAQTMYAYPDEIRAWLDKLKQTVKKYSNGQLHTFTEGVKPHIGIDLARGKDRTVKQLVKVQPSGKVESVGEITGPMQRIIDAIAWFEGVGIAAPKQAAVAFLAGYTYGGGAFNNPRGALRSAGLVEYAGESIRLTEEGRVCARYPDVPLTVDELQRHVMSVLPGPHQKILSVLISKYPNAISKDECAALAGYAPGGAFNNPLGRLRSMGLVDYPQPGYVVAESLLFLE